MKNEIYISKYYNQEEWCYQKLILFKGKVIVCKLEITSIS